MYARFDRSFSVSFYNMSKQKKGDLSGAAFIFSCSNIR